MVWNKMSPHLVSNVALAQSVFVKYFFNLSSLAEANNHSYHPKTLMNKKSQKLEAKSQLQDEKISFIMNGL